MQFDRLKRRELMVLLGGAVAWPLAAHAQQPAVPVIGLLHAQSLEAFRAPMTAFHEGLAETGYVDDKNVAIEYRWAEGHIDRLPALVGELLSHQPALIVVCGSTPGARLLKAATRTVPIVFLIGPDPVAAGLVDSLNHPGGNLTGVTVFNVEVIAKRLQLLHELVPAATSIAFLVNPTNAAATEAEMKEMQNAAGLLNLRLLVLNASTASEIEAAFENSLLERAGALVVSGETLFSAQRNQLVTLAARRRVPAIYQTRADAMAGGLISYGTNTPDSYRQIGIYAGRILKGEKPADLPVQQATKIDLVINLKAAKALDLAVPPPLLVRADEVIE